MGFFVWESVGIGVGNLRPFDRPQSALQKDGIPLNERLKYADQGMYLDDLAEDSDDRVVEIVARSPHLTPPMIGKILKLRWVGIDVLKALMLNPRTPEKYLREMAKRSFASAARQWLMFNPNVPEDVLIGLALEEDFLKKSILAYEKIPQHVKVAILLAGGEM